MEGCKHHSLSVDLIYDLGVTFQNKIFVAVVFELE